MSRIVFLGQKPVAEDAFARLLAAQNDSLSVVAAGSNESAEGVWWGSNSVATLAKEIPFLPSESNDERRLLEVIEETGADTIISVQHPHILSSDVLERFGGQAFNLHNAKLPDYRGSNAANHAILNGETEFSSTLHWMVRKVDSGSIAFEDKFFIGDDETGESLYRRAAEAGLRCFDAWLDCLLTGKAIPRHPVPSGGHFYPGNSIAGLREIKDADDAVEVDRKSRAFYFPPFEPAYLVRGGRKFHVLPSTAAAGTK